MSARAVILVLKSLYGGVAFGLVTAVVCWLSWDPSLLVAQPYIAPAREYKVKGVFLYSFGRYVEWPAIDEAPDFVIGVLGDSLIDSTLAGVAQKKELKGKRIKIRQFARPDNIEFCHILFISHVVSAEDEQQALQIASGQGMLTVGETTEFTSRGGCIGFLVDGETIRFQINVTATKAERLQLDAKLLRIGEVVSFPAQ